MGESCVAARISVLPFGKMRVNLFLPALILIFAAS